MSTCKDCVHYEVCKDEIEFHRAEPSDLEVDGIEAHCDHFKPKSRFVELPCEVGQKVAVITSKTSNGKNLYIFEDTVSHFIVSDYVFMCFDNHNLSEADYNWHNVFFGENAREEAEKALAERSK